MLTPEQAQAIVESNKALNDPLNAGEPLKPVPPDTTGTPPGMPAETGPTQTYFEWAQVVPVLDLHTSAFVNAYGWVTTHKMDLDTVYLHLAAINIHPPQVLAAEGERFGIIQPAGATA